MRGFTPQYLTIFIHLRVLGVSLVSYISFIEKIKAESTLNHNQLRTSDFVKEEDYNF